jgi:acetoacetyl-CoA synthetase
MREVLWSPSEERVKETNLTQFITWVSQKYEKKINSYEALYEWSIQDIPSFWSAIWNYSGIISSTSYQEVLVNKGDMLNAQWFPGARLNYAENLLRYRDDKIAIIFKGEATPVQRLTYAELYLQVGKLAKSLKDIGVTPGDRVVGFIPNLPQAVIAMLATASIGAIWSSCSPDFGVRGVIDRFGQIEPKVLFAADGYFYNGKTHDSLEKVKQIHGALPSLEKIILIPYTQNPTELLELSQTIPDSEIYDKFLSQNNVTEIEFAQMPFDHPLYILYSSGTTGVPKGIVHGAGGTLIQHLKEHLLHTDLTRNDRLFYFTTCSWMMWNWLVGALAIGATLVLYDGSPFYPDPGTLWQLAQDEEITVFGTSAKYLASLEQSGMKPRNVYDLTPLKGILSTGSPLTIENFHFVYQEIKHDLCLSSISGGTDIVSCFALGNPTGPVIAGELQCRGLGMKVESYDSLGRSLINKKGELVCTAPFPSRPIYFWNDPQQVKYKKAYYDVYPGVWRHGDFIEITSEGGVIIYGRSDATLNPGGVRIGTAEIYRQVETLSEITDSLVIGQRWQDDIRIILFVKLAQENTLTDSLKEKIRHRIRANTTPRHVPAKIISIPDIPYTLNGKKVELAVYNIIHNQPVANREVLANPEALDAYVSLPELQRD